MILKPLVPSQLKQVKTKLLLATFNPPLLTTHHLPSATGRGSALLWSSSLPACNLVMSDRKSSSGSVAAAGASTSPAGKCVRWSSSLEPWHRISCSKKFSSGKEAFFPCAARRVSFIRFKMAGEGLRPGITRDFRKETREKQYYCAF